MSISRNDHFTLSNLKVKGPSKVGGHAVGKDGGKRLKGGCKVLASGRGVDRNLWYQRKRCWGRHSQPRRSCVTSCNHPGQLLLSVLLCLSGIGGEVRSLPL